MSSVELLSVHVPKTAGTAFRTIVERVYGADRVHTVYPVMDGPPTELTSYEEWLADSVAMCRTGGSGPRVVHGHYSLRSYADRFPRAVGITWLRHPVDRLVSFYFMWRELPLQPRSPALQLAVHQGDVDLLGFARAPAYRDQVTRHFLGSPDGRGLRFIGIQERFEEDLMRLAAQLGWPPVEVPRVNVNNSTDYSGRSIDPAIRDEIARLNPGDMHLYQDVFDGHWQPHG